MGKRSQIAERLAPVGREELGPRIHDLPSWLVGRPEWRTVSAGALVVGGDYRALGTVRSLGRRGIPVWVLTDDHLIAGLSKYARRRLDWPKTNGQAQVDYLIDLSARHDLHGWTLFPSNDENAALISRHHASLRNRFRLTVPPWHVFRWGYDKRLTYRLATTLGIPVPWTYVPGNREDVGQLQCRFPVLVKPAVKPELNALTVARAWRVDDRPSLLKTYDEACTMVDPGAVMIQELVPGAGEEQFSYAALCVEGQTLASLVARRNRQYPIDFGRSSTFVETIYRREVEAAGKHLLAAISYTGVVELEFKRDPVTDEYKLLDINPRIWGWHTLGQRAGVDFSHLMWRLSQGERLGEMTGRPGVSWMRFSTDLAAAFAEIWRGRLSAGEYLKSFRGSVESAVFAIDDPIPALMELPLAAYMMLKRRRF